jgi:arsenite/tail-anchored protein-transporting ATPase
VAVFHAFSGLVNEARRGWVVLDTAPTGHSLLLLDTAGAYHREVLRNATLAPDRITTPLMRLQDPSLTHVLIATLAETTPVEEARMLQDDLRRAGIEPWAWVVNRSLAAASPSDPLLAHRARQEVPLIQRVRDGTGPAGGGGAVAPGAPRWGRGPAGPGRDGAPAPAIRSSSNSPRSGSQP